MQRQLTDEQIAQARSLRAQGRSYAEIKAAIGADVAAASIRAHCADVPVPTLAGTRLLTRSDKTRVARDGRVIRPFSAVEDAAIVEWVTAPPDGTMADLARSLDRKQHSVAARIKTLRKHGKLPLSVDAST